MSKPVIAVTTSVQGGLASWIFLRLAVRRAGGKPVRITPRSQEPLPCFDALILSGGSDVDPGLYGEKPLALPREEREARKRSLLRLFSFIPRMFIALLVYLIRRFFTGLKRPPSRDEARDALETRLIGQAVRDDKPILGICRGMQLLNVSLGGGLFQSIADRYEDVSHPYTALPHKQVFLSENSRLAAIFSARKMYVNSLHHQAVSETGKGLQTSALDEADVIQAIEDPAHLFRIGVQWHPEFLPQHRRQQRLFKAFVAAARMYALSGPCRNRNASEGHSP